MWKCKNCSEENENNFSSCWKCSYSRSGTPPKEDQNSEGEAFLPNGQLLSQAAAKHVKARANDLAENGQQRAVVIVDVDIPFGSMVTFMVKWAIASIPAFIILLILALLFGGLLGGFGGLIYRMSH